MRRKVLASILVVLACQAVLAAPPAGRAGRPNVIVILTDDQGCGDYSVAGNPVLKTPALDALAAGGTYLTRFYVSPVCTPTRACLMTGRYNFRTRAIDTYVGRAMMEPEETTIAEALRGAGYATGIFGKWHLGDNYPMRAMDQGFEESLVHRGGGIGQPSDPVGGEGKYTDPVLFHNGQQVQTKGYCTDVYFDAAMDWMAGQRNKPFFAYIATNAPHSPLGDVPRELYEQYRSMDLSAAMLPGLKPAKAAQEADALARIFAMVANIDANVGRLMQRLRQLDLLDNTLVLFFNDNGPASPRYVGPLRGQKSEVFEGGVRAALFAHWPAAIRAGRRCDVMAAHIDLMPTILEACGVAAPQHLRLDGRSILPLLTGKGMENWPDRSIVLQAHRGNVPVIYHNFVVETPRWTLLNASGFGLDAPRGAPKFELYDVTADPGEAHDVAAAHPEIVERLRQEYEAWFKDVSSTRADNYAPPRIHIGSPHEPTVVLTRQDWRRPAGEHQGYGTSGTWLLRAERAGAYQVRLRFPAVASAGTVELKLGPRTSTLPLKAGDTQCVFDKLVLEPGDADLRAVLTVGGREQGPWQADVTGP